jgi:hypothetical protein
VAHNSRARLLRFDAALIFTILMLATACSRPQAKPALTPEGRAYVKNLQLSNVNMQASDSLARQTLTEILGNIKNTGDRTVNRVEVTCVFYDSNNRPLYQERVAMVKSALKPGELRPFRLAFDTIPDDWNNQLPALAIALVVFG